MPGSAKDREYSNYDQLGMTGDWGGAVGLMGAWAQEANKNNQKQRVVDIMNGSGYAEAQRGTNHILPEGAQSPGLWDQITGGINRFGAALGGIGQSIASGASWLGGQIGEYTNSAYDKVKGWFASEQPFLPDLASPLLLEGIAQYLGLLKKTTDSKQALHDSLLAKKYYDTTVDNAKAWIDSEFAGAANASLRERLYKTLDEYKLIWDTADKGAPSLKDYIKKLGSVFGMTNPVNIPLICTPEQLHNEFMLVGNLEQQKTSGQIAGYREAGNRYVILDTAGNEVGMVLRGTTYLNQLQNTTVDGQVNGGNMCQITSTAMLLGKYGITVSPDQLYADWRAAGGTGPPSENVIEIMNFAMKKYAQEKFAFGSVEAVTADRPNADDVIKDWLKNGHVVQAATFLTTGTGQQITIVGYRTDSAGNKLWITNDPGGYLNNGGYGASNDGSFAEYRFDRHAVDFSVSGAPGHGKRAIGDRRIYRAAGPGLLK